MLSGTPAERRAGRIARGRPGRARPAPAPPRVSGSARASPRTRHRPGTRPRRRAIHPGRAGLRRGRLGWPAGRARPGQDGSPYRCGPRLPWRPRRE